MGGQYGYCNDTTAVAGKSYYYKVKAICAAEPYANSALSAAVRITCK